MTRRSAELAIARGEAQKASSVPSRVEAELGELERQINGNGDRPISTLLAEVVDRLCSMTRADGAAIAVRDQWGVVCRASVGNAPEVGSRLQPDSALTRECFETGTVVVCEDAETDFRVHSVAAKSLRLRSAVVVPIRAREPVPDVVEVLGLLEVLSSRPFTFDAVHVDGLKRIAELLASALAPAHPQQPEESILGAVALPAESEKPKSKRPAFLVTAAVLFSLLLLLVPALLRRKQLGASSTPGLSPASISGSPVQSTLESRGAPSRESDAQRVERESRLSAGTSATMSSPSSGSSPGTSAQSLAAPRETLPLAQSQVAENVVENQAAPVVSPIVPAPVIPGLDVQASKTSTTTATLEPLGPPTLNAPAKAPILAFTPAIPSPVAPVIPDFVLDRTLKAHSGWVTGVAFSPDGKRLASGSWDRTVKFWQVSTGDQLSTVAGKMKEVQSLAFSRDGRWLATENSSDGVSLRDPTTGQELLELPSDKPLGPLGSNWVYSIAFSPDGRWLASGVDDKTVRLWDVKTGRKVRDLTGLRRPVIYIAFSPDGRLLATGDDSKTIRIWDASSGEQVYKLSGHKKAVYAVAFSPNGHWLASASADKTVKLWDLTTGREVHALSGHENVVTSLAFSPDGRWLVSGSWDKTIKIWDVEAGRELQTLAGHDHRVYSVAFDARGLWLASGSEDGTIQLWRLTDTADQSRLQR